MKNKLLIVLLLIICLITGCKSKNVVCKINVDNKLQNYKQDSIYKIYYKKNYVNKIDKVDSFYSSDENQIKYLEEINNIILDNNNKTYGGYEYSVDVTKTSLIIKTNINIKNLNKNNLIKNNIIEEDYVIGDNITLNGIINYYKSKGAKCDI